MGEECHVRLNGVVQAWGMADTKHYRARFFEKTALHMVAAKFGPESYFSALTVASWSCHSNLARETNPAKVS